MPRDVLDRVPSTELRAAFDGGLLDVLREPLGVSVEGERLLVDVDFREGDAVALHVGQSALLSLRRREDGAFVASASKRYAEQPVARALLRRWPPDEAEAFGDALRRYVGGLEVPRRFLLREGRVQHRWSGHDADVTGAAPWTPVSRDVTLAPRGTASRALRASLPPRAPVLAAQEALHCLAEAQRWAPPPMLRRLSALDQLAVSWDGCKLVLLACCSRVSDDAHYAPLELLRALAAWSRALDERGAELVQAVRDLANAREALGFGAKTAPLVDTPALLPVIAFSEPPSHAARARLFEVLRVLAPFAPCEAFRALEVWAWPTNEAPRRVHHAPELAPRDVRSCPFCGSRVVVPVAPVANDTGRVRSCARCGGDW